MKKVIKIGLDGGIAYQLFTLTNENYDLKKKITSKKAINLFFAFMNICC